MNISLEKYIKIRELLDMGANIDSKMLEDLADFEAKNNLRTLISNKDKIKIFKRPILEELKCMQVRL